ncbi:type IV pilus modification protein PilV [Gammaproteobacteria bacterium]|nr:type IV pilus modification protein PilV [Gammaproteobacteria bacterium]|tara:strand:- start:411 stop:878 length:468 start_codon:yes stop_codon:yes gene_type:complete
MKNYIKYKKRNKGFTLIEVLIAMLILAIGVLGVAGLQFKALRFNHDAYLRTQISILASDIMDQIRLNQNDSNAYISNHTAPTVPGACVITNAITAANDLNCWYAQINEIMPPGSTANIQQINVTNSGISNAQYNITLSWTDREGTLRNISYTLQP